MLKITNTLKRKKEIFKPLESGQVKLYVCGITPYDFAHIGHGRCYVTFDLLYRLFKFLNFKVKYVRNFTDIDDKLLKKAEKEFGDRFKYKEIASKFIDYFHQDMEKLNCLIPDVEPRATDYINKIIEFARRLIETGHAYVADGDVYFHVKSFLDYGKLSGRKLEDMKVGARVQASDIKKDPLDFALWKSEKEAGFWKSPWGYGRPGWHIECSVMAFKNLGEHIDIHGGGMDLIFPHHENEIAQSESLFGPNFANYWMHNAFVQMNKEKMSKSLGNFFTLREVFKQFDPMVLRYYFLKHSYRAPLDFSLEQLKSAEKNYKKLCVIFGGVECKRVDKKEILENKIVKKMLDFLLDDLNTSGALGILFENLHILEKNNKALCQVKYFLTKVFGFKLNRIEEKNLVYNSKIEALINERQKARENRDWAKADKIREQLINMGYEVKDTKLNRK